MTSYLPRPVVITLSVCLLACLHVTAFASHATHANKQQQFIELILPRAQAANQSVLQLRNKIINLKNKYAHNKTLSHKESEWLHSRAADYGVKFSMPAGNKQWQELLTRIDTIPISLLLAQAANETAWGQSRFAKHGNNYFGQHCSHKGCGLVPKRRRSGSTMEVRRFKNITASVNSYIHNLNSNRAYHELRSIRAQLRAKHKSITGLRLSTGLKHYSQRGRQYVDIIQGIIKKYGLGKYDKSR